MYRNDVPRVKGQGANSSCSTGGKYDSRYDYEKRGILVKATQHEGSDGGMATPAVQRQI